MVEKQQPKVSVIMPIYNAASFLDETLQNILGQTFKEIEIILANDGSTDNSLEIMKKYAAQDERIKILDLPHKNAGAARNAGLDIAKGKYLSFLDSDDIFEANMLEILFEAAERYAADYIVCGYDVIELSGKQRLGWLQWELCPDNIPFNKNDVSHSLFQLFTPNTWNKFLSAKFINKHFLRFQEIENTNDLYFTSCALLFTETIVPIREVLIHKKERQNNLSHSKEKDWTCFYIALRELQKTLKSHLLYKRFERDFYNMVLGNCIWQLERLEAQAYEKCFATMKQEWMLELGLYRRPYNYWYNPDYFYFSKKILRPYLVVVFLKFLKSLRRIAKPERRSR